MANAQNKVAAPGVAPIGTIVPFAGPISGDTDIQWLKNQGWLYCDGRPLAKRDYIDLFLVLGNNYGGDLANFNLPDFRGRFQRGTQNRSMATPSDPDSALRVASNPGGNIGDNVGSLQGYATAVAKSPKSFATNTTGEHTHSVAHVPISNNAYAIAGSHYGLWTNHLTTTSASGKHFHTVNGGGDKETRSINKYVNFIIKYKDAV